MVTIGLAIYIISAIGAILYIRYDSEYDETYPDRWCITFGFMSSIKLCCSCV